MKNKRSSLTSQVKSRKSPRNKVRFPKNSNPCPQFSFEGSPWDELSVMDPTKRELLNLIVWYKSKHQFIFPSQDSLGKRIGITREWTNKLIKQLNAEGWIGKWYRHMRSSYYNINRIFFDFSSRPFLQRLLSNVAHLSCGLALLLTCSLTGKKPLEYGTFYNQFTQSNLNTFNTYIRNQKKKRIYDLEERAVGMPLDQLEIRPEILSQDSKKTGARLSLSASASRCCGMCMVLGERLCTEPSPVSTKRKGEGSPVLGDSDPVDKNQAGREPWRPSSSLSVRNEFERSRKLRRKSIAMLSEKEKGHYEFNKAQFEEIANA